MEMPRARTAAAAPGFLYVVKLREHVVSGERVFKVGRTRDLVTRINAYPNGSSLLLCKQVEDTLTCEAAALRALRATPGLVHRRDLGAEYFEGAVDAVLDAVHAAAAPPDDAVGSSHVIWRARKLRPIRVPAAAHPLPATPRSPPQKRAAAAAPPAKAASRPLRRCVDAIHALLAVRRAAYEARGVVPVADITADAAALSRSLGWGCEARLTPATVAAKVCALADAREVATEGRRKGAAAALAFRTDTRSHLSLKVTRCRPG